MLLDENGQAQTEQEQNPAQGEPSQNQQEEAPTAGGTEPAAKPEAKSPKSFTQEMVDEIVRSRLERDRKATWRRYGVQTRDELDGLVGKAQSYDVMKERYEATKTENSSLKEKMAFMSKNINPNREEDIRAYFNGKGIEFNETNLINELATHPEWLNAIEQKEGPQTTIDRLGVDHQGKPSQRESEDEKMKRIFGV